MKINYMYTICTYVMFAKFVKKNRILFIRSTLKLLIFYSIYIKVVEPTEGKPVLA